MADNQSGGVYITIADIYQEVTGMRDDLNSGLSDLRNAVENVKDHEKRLRVLESRPVITWRAFLTALGAAGAMVAAAVPFIDKIYGG